MLYVSEQTKASLGMQMREIGFDGSEPVEEFRAITREDWSRFFYTDFLVHLEKEYLTGSGYNTMIIDTFHTIARMEDERDGAECNKLGNLTIDVASRNSVALVLGRHDRKAGGEVGVSGRSSIQLSGLVDVIAHLLRYGDNPNQRKLELVGRVPGLPPEQTVELMPNGEYFNWANLPKRKDKNNLAPSTPSCGMIQNSASEPSPNVWA